MPPASVFGERLPSVQAEQGPPQFTGVSLVTSSQALPIPVVWGTRRVSPSLIWGGLNPLRSFFPSLDPNSPAHTPGSPFIGDATALVAPDATPTPGSGYSPPGTGGISVQNIPPPGGWLGGVFVQGSTAIPKNYPPGGSPNQTLYGSSDPNSADSRYWVPIEMALCFGVIDSVSRVWSGKGSGAVDVNWTGGVAPATGLDYLPTNNPAIIYYTLFKGTSSQIFWGFFSYVSGLPAPLTHIYDSQNISYRHIAYIASTVVDFGHDNHVPQQSFEVQRTTGFNPVVDSYSLGFDVCPADIIFDLLTNVLYGMGLLSGDIDSTSLGTYRAYCMAQGLLLSVLLDTQQAGTDVLNRIATVTNTWIFWDGTAIRFVPLGDETVTGNGHTFTPDKTPAYDIADFISPIVVQRADPIDCFNRVRIEVNDRNADYAKNPLEWKDTTLINQFGLRDASDIDGQDVCDQIVGAKVVELYGKRLAYIRNVLSFTLDMRYLRLLPGTIVTVNDANLGLVQYPVRIRTIEEDENGNLAITAEEYAGVLGISRATPPQSWTQGAGAAGSTSTSSGSAGSAGMSSSVVVSTGGSSAPPSTIDWVKFTAAAGALLLPGAPIDGHPILYQHIPDGTTTGGRIEPSPFGTPVTLNGNGGQIYDGTPPVLVSSVSLNVSWLAWEFTWDQAANSGAGAWRKTRVS